MPCSQSVEVMYKVIQRNLPALLMRTSRYPYLLETVSNAFEMDVSSSMSTWMGSIALGDLGYSSRASWAAVAAFSKLLPPRRIVYTFEERHKALTVSRPRPVFAPVMRTIVPDAMSSMLLFK